MEWISVKDRLPEDKSKSVLACLDTHEILIRKCSKYKFVECNKRVVTHWMPLPQPPEDK